MTTTNLKKLATIIGWKLINEDDGFSNYEYVTRKHKTETVSHIVRIHDVMSDEEFAETLKILQCVLPVKLKNKVNKLTRKIRNQNMAGVIEVVTFIIEEYKQKSLFTKLESYAKAVGADLEKMGYEYEYELSKAKEVEILAKIESHVPMEKLPALGKIKKIELKINYIEKTN